MASANDPRGVIVIGGFKLLKGILLLAIGIGALHLIHKDVADFARNVADAFGIDSSNRLIHRLIEKISGVSSRKLEELSAASFFYSGVLLTEGVGLLLRKHWAEYLVIVTTASFVPIEIYELVRHLTALKLGVVVVNVVIVAYLVRVVRRHRRTTAA